MLNYYIALLFKQNFADDGMDNNNTRFKSGKKKDLQTMYKVEDRQCKKKQCECLRIKVISILEKNKGRME